MTPKEESGMNGKAKTLEELFIRKFESLEAENAELTEKMHLLAHENGALRECDWVEPDYKAEYERLRKELYEANRKIETLMWSLEKIKDAMSADEGGK